MPLLPTDRARIPDLAASSAPSIMAPRPMPEREVDQAAGQGQGDGFIEASFGSSLLRNFRSAKKVLDPSGAKTISEIIPDGALDRITDAKIAGAPDARVGSHFNLDRIASDDDVLSVVQRLGETYEGIVVKQTRGVVSNVDTRKLAQQFASDMGDEGLAKMILERKTGQLWNAHQMLAARDLYVSTVEDLVKSASEVISSGGAPEAQVRMRHRMALAAAIHAQVKGAQTEAGRALQAFAIPSKGRAPIATPPGTQPGVQAQATDPGMGHNGGPIGPLPGAAPGSVWQSSVLQNAVTGSGGPLVNTRAAQFILQAYQQGGLGLASQVARKARKKNTVDALLEAMIGHMVSNPKTWVLAAAGNASVSAIRAMEHGIAGVSGAVFRGFGSQAGASLADALQFWYGQTLGMADGIKLAGGVLRHGDTASKFSDGVFEPAFTAETFGNSTLGQAAQAGIAATGRLPGGQLMEPALLKAAGALGAVTDFVGEYYFRLPFRVLGAEDELFRAMQYTGELRAGAMRYARENANTPQDVQALFQQAMSDPEQFVPTVHFKALEQARRDVLQEPATTAAGRHLTAFVNAPYARVVAKPVLPFVRVVNNTLAWSWDRVPLKYATPGQVGQDARALITDPATRDMEIAKMVTGATLLATGWGAVAFDAFSGGGAGGDPKSVAGARLMGRQGNSIVFRDPDGTETQYDISRMDPATQIVLITAMTAEMVALAETDAQADEIVLAAVTSFKDSMTDKTVLQGVADAMELFAPTTSERFMDRLRSFVAKRVASAAVPAWSAEIARQERPTFEDTRPSDPYASQAGQFLSETYNRMLARMPSVVSDRRLPDHVNLFGEPAHRPEGWGPDWLSPVATSKPRFTRDQVRAALPPHLHNRPSLRGMRVGTDLTPDELGALIDVVGPHGELERLNMPVDKRKREWKGVELTPTEYNYITTLEGEDIFFAIDRTIGSRMYREAPDEAAVQGSKADLLRYAVRQVRDRTDQRLRADPDWFRVNEGVRLRDKMIRNRPPAGEEGKSPDRAVRDLLRGAAP